MSASAALKRYREENRGVSISASSEDCAVEVSGNIRFIHKGDFFGEVLSRNGNQIFVKSLGKRKFQALVAEISETEIEISEIPEEVSLAVAL